MTLYTVTDKVEALVREIKFRRRVYARRIDDGKMTVEKATYDPRRLSGNAAEGITGVKRLRCK